MELRRTRAGWISAMVFLPFGALLVLAGLTASPRHLMIMIFGGSSLIFGAVMLGSGLTPFRFVVSADGLDVRSTGIRTVVPWRSIEAVILVQPPTVKERNRSALLLLVPAAGANLGVALDSRTPDGRDCVEILSLVRVRESPDQVAAALAQFGGSRFTDARVAASPELATPDFTITLRGYDTVMVAELVRRGQEALNSGSMFQHLMVKAEIESASIPTELRGYDRQQVDAYLAKLAASLVIAAEG